MSTDRPVVLVANRGEIAARIVAAAQRIGAEAVLADSAADTQSLAARAADRVLVIGPAPSAQSYLSPELIAQAAVHAGADVVHPGYGFLSEQPRLCELLEEEGIAFAGPRPETLRAVGDKGSARAVAVAAGVPVSQGRVITDVHDVAALGAEVGYPLMVKAIHGGGGRGIRLATTEAELVALAPQAAQEAAAAFGNGALIFGDRDCSVQRRHQKLIEGCPAPGVSAERRRVLHDASRALVEALRYRGAGTVEFLVDTLSDDVVFLEVNARIQVEHPVTEEAFGVDLVAAQLLLALGLPTGLPVPPAVPPAVAIEVRINAEDPAADFRPNAGRIGQVRWPRGPGIRIDTQIESGFEFPPYYDSLAAKLIVRAHDRAAAVDGALAAVRNTRVEGLTTTLPMLEAVLAHEDFRAGPVPTTWFGQEWESMREKIG